MCKVSPFGCFLPWQGLSAATVNCHGRGATSQAAATVDGARPKVKASGVVALPWQGKASSAGRKACRLLPCQRGTGPRSRASARIPSRTSRRESRRVRLRKKAGVRGRRCRQVAGCNPEKGAGCNLQGAGCRKRKQGLSFPKGAGRGAGRKPSNFNGFPLQAEASVQGQCYAVRHGSSGPSSGT